jgi:hypothetical protein
MNKEEHRLGQELVHAERSARGEQWRKSQEDSAEFYEWVKGYDAKHADHKLDLKTCDRVRTGRNPVAEQNERRVREVLLGVVRGNLELLAALVESPPKEIDIKWWEIIVRPNKRKHKKSINALNRRNHSKWKVRLMLEVFIAGACGVFVWFLFVRILSSTGIEHVALSFVPASLFSMWMLSGATTRNPQPETIQLQDSFDSELVLGGGGFVSGALGGSLVGSHVGLALGPLGAIAGTVPGALLGGLLGWFGGTNVAAHYELRKSGRCYRSTGVKAGAAGCVAGVASGAWVGSSIGLALGPLGAIAGTIPGAAVGGLIGFLSGSRIARS